ncbi:hypothetical protein EIP91_001469, partial [Steccherinum ochraceum]
MVSNAHSLHLGTQTRRTLHAGATTLEKCTCPLHPPHPRVLREDFRHEAPAVVPQDAPDSLSMAP